MAIAMASGQRTSQRRPVSRGAKTGANNTTDTHRVGRGVGRVPGRQSLGTAKAATAPGRAYPNPISSGGDEMSPRLMHLDESIIVLAPLLPEVDDKPQERFCTDRAIDMPGLPSNCRSAVGEHPLPFPQLVARVEASVGQAMLLLNDRLRTLQLRSRTLWISETQIGELCKIADCVQAAAYHLQKWAALFPSSGLSKPKKPSHCEDKDEAFALMQSASPRLLMASSAANKGMLSIVKEQEEKDIDDTEYCHRPSTSSIAWGCPLRTSAP